MATKSIKRPKKTESIPKIVKQLIKLQADYCNVHRAIVTKERYSTLVEPGILKKFTFDHVAIREPLIEHVGHLPIIAAYFHPRIKNKVDLGKSLIMLAVHDVGETVTGDIVAYKKTAKDSEVEYIEAKKRLPKELMKYFDEFEEQETNEAKFAKSVDAIAPILHEFSIPKICVARMSFLGFNLDDVKTKKEKYFIWDPVLLKTFDYLIRELKKEEARCK